MGRDLGILVRVSGLRAELLQELRAVAQARRVPLKNVVAAMIPLSAPAFRKVILDGMARNGGGSSWSTHLPQRYVQLIGRVADELGIKRERVLALLLQAHEGRMDKPASWALAAGKLR